ncbi:hypothetical protein BDV98DRAFT_596955 [Pterulicium gracile]|uniref:LysM domain-containing protein n=1 Tax=Pterulicium gracile TaxID=1884261 RepID=A0A5C3Q5A8_9AGAR|nr:hypothetical protein BDV98DRAFT_596955 [Pterula gracilis]
MKAIAVALAFFTSLTIAGPVSLASSLYERDCPSIPSEADDNILRQVFQITRNRGVSDKVLLATFETCWVESHCHNLPCGDQDSIGVFQQRPSQGWGSYNQIMDVNYSTNKFLDYAIPTAAQNPNAAAGTIAQMVQRSEYPDRYNQSEGKARQLIDRARQLVGGNPPPTGACRQNYTVANGDVCWSIAQRFGISVAQLQSWNGAINSGCTNLAIGQQLCVAK